MQIATINIETPNGESINKIFPVNNQENVIYLAGYMQALRDKGATVKVVSTSQE